MSYPEVYPVSEIKDMDKFSSRIAELIAAYLNNELDEQGQIELDTWVNASTSNKQWFDRVTTEETVLKAAIERKASKTEGWEKVVKLVAQDESEAKVLFINRKRRWMTAGAAAAVVIIATASFFLFDMPSSKPHSASVNTLPQLDREPGSGGAVLELADGKKIILDQTKDGSIAHEGQIDIIKSDSALTYSGQSNREPVMNTLTTPRGRFFRLKLADGTVAWLNSGSHIIYPTSFTKKERRVKVAGEVYLEVAKQSTPFRVEVDGMLIEVLGTHFNVNAYKDDGTIQTTLVEGKVKVANNLSSVVLLPRQQAQLRDDKLTIKTDADVEAVTAWVNGMMVFDGVDLRTLLAQIGRWYDVDFEIAGEVAIPPLHGKVRRNTNLSELLQTIEDNSKLKFEIEDTKVIVRQHK